MKHSLRFQVIAFAMIRMVVNTMHRMMYPFLTVFARGLGVDIAAISLALTSRQIVGAVGSFLSIVLDHRGRKTGMLISLGLFSGGILLVAFWPIFPVFLITLMLTTLGKYMFDPYMHGYLGDRIPYEKRGFPMAVAELGWSLAFIAGIPLMGFLISRSGWVSPFGVLGILGLAGFLLIAWMIPRTPQENLTNPGILQKSWQVLRYPPALLGLTIGISATVANEVINLVFGVWLEDSFQLEILALGGAAAVIGLAELGGESLMAGITDRLGKERSVALGLGANCLAAISFPFLGVSLSGAVVGLFLFYLTFEFTLVSILPMMTEIMPGTRVTLMAFNLVGLSLGRALGALIAPWLYAWGIEVSTLAAVAFNLLALVALWRLWIGRKPAQS